MDTTRQETVKCVIWDLDNTVWHGTLSENDVLQLRPDIQQIMQTLDSWGIVQSVASKNDAPEAMAKLTEYGLADYFLYPQINWGPKSASVKAISSKLNIGLDALVFIDDQAFERDEVTFEYPQVRCFDVTVLDDLLTLNTFRPRFITSESAGRRQLYLADEQRNQEAQRVGNNQQFLAQLGLRFLIAKATTADLQRVEELTVRTNQLNSTGYTYSYAELEQLLHSPRHQVLVCELTDRYGSYGKIGVALLEHVGDDWFIRLLLMSCRVMARGVGTVLLHYLIKQAKANGKELYAPFYHTDRNRVMYITYKFAGFETVEQQPDGGELLVYQGPHAPAYPPAIQVEEPAAI
jgi:FkbH-like protein